MESQGRIFQSPSLTSKVELFPLFPSGALRPDNPALSLGLLPSQQPCLCHLLQKGLTAPASISHLRVTGQTRGYAISFQVTPSKGQRSYLVSVFWKNIEGKQLNRWAAQATYVLGVLGLFSPLI